MSFAPKKMCRFSDSICILEFCTSIDLSFEKERLIYRPFIEPPENIYFVPLWYYISENFSTTTALLFLQVNWQFK